MLKKISIYLLVFIFLFTPCNSIYAKSNATHKSKIEAIRKNYNDIQKNLKKYQKNSAKDSYAWYFDENNKLRKVVLYPNKFDKREEYEEYYYDKDEHLIFAYIYDKNGKNEKRFYFTKDRLLIRSIDANNKIRDYKKGKDPSDDKMCSKYWLAGCMELHYRYS